MKPQQSLLKSFANAFVGMGYFFANDRNGKIHLAITLIVLAAGLAFQISAIEWILILLCIALVIGLEMLNTALEKLCDMVEPNHHATIKVIKDVSAAAVVLASIISVIIGIIIFLPKALLLL
jgi:diacylglycerol kinase